MHPSGDELAGVVDLFGALGRPQLRRAVEEAAFRAGREVDRDALDAAIDDAVESYRLVAYDPPGTDAEPHTETRTDSEIDGTLLAVGPTAFPTLPEAGEDLPHIMDVEPRDPKREALADAVTRRFRAETARAVDEGDRERIALLLDVSYDLETWGPVDLSEMRDRLDDVLADG